MPPDSQNQDPTEQTNQNGQNDQSQNQDPNTDLTNSNPPIEPGRSVDTTGDTARQQLFLSRMLDGIANLQMQVDDLRKTRTELVEEKATPVAAQDFLSDPDKHFSERLNQALDKQLGPIRNFIGTYQSREQLQNVKAAIAAQNPNYASFIQAYGQHIDSVLGRNPPTLENVMFAMNSIAGAIQFGQIPAITPQQQQNNQQQISNVTPTIRSKPPSPARKDVKSKEVRLTERNRAAARALGLSEKDIQEAYKEGLLSQEDYESLGEKDD